jgi:hypothetical protein
VTSGSTNASRKKFVVPEWTTDTALVPGLSSERWQADVKEKEKEKQERKGRSGRKRGKRQNVKETELVRVKPVMEKPSR